MKYNDNETHFSPVGNTAVIYARSNTSVYRPT